VAGVVDDQRAGSASADIDAEKSHTSNRAGRAGRAGKTVSCLSRPFCPSRLSCH
jgi:hypothetical protein